MTVQAAPADVFRAISDPTRRAVLDRLQEGELPVGRIADSFDMTLSAVSQHLRILAEANLVTQRRVGRQRLYAINGEPLREVSGWLASYERFWNHKLDALGEYLERSTSERGGR